MCPGFWDAALGWYEPIVLESIEHHMVHLQQEMARATRCVQKGDSLMSPSCEDRVCVQRVPLDFRDAVRYV